MQLHSHTRSFSFLAILPVECGCRGAIATGTGEPVAFVLRVHGTVRGCRLSGEWMDWMNEEDHPSDCEDGRWGWLSGGYQER